MLAPHRFIDEQYAGRQVPSIQRLSDELSHLFPQRVVFEIREFASIEVHAVFPTDFITNMWLISIFYMFHLLAADWAIDVSNFVVCLANLDIAAI